MNTLQTATDNQSRMVASMELESLVPDAAISKTPAAWFALRRTLPPWRFEELLEELIEDLPAQGVDEVIVIIDTEEFSHGFPSLDWIRNYQPMLHRARQALHEVGIVYSLNPWVTLGHVSRERQMPDVTPAIHPVIAADGNAETCIACPLSPGWRAYQAQAWRLYAETRPAVIWIEDDIRSFGHHFCLCPLHMARFSTRVDRVVTREESHRALVQSGRPHPWRIEFMRMQDEIMREATSHLASTVHAVSPHTRIGLMSSGPRNHVQEGRNWKALATAMSTNGRSIFSRPTLGNYWEWDLRGFYFSQDSIKITRHALPVDAIDLTEVEAVPFSRTANSIAFLATKLAISFAYGARGVTLNIFDHLGSPMRDVPQFGKLLAELKPCLNALAEETQRPGIYRGIRLFHFDHAVDTAHLPDGAQLSALRGDGDGAVHAFEAAGIPTTYERSEVVALIGQQPRLIPDDELHKLLRGGVFLDGPAAEILCRRGFGEWIGLRAAGEPLALSEHGAISAEELIHPDFDGAPRRYLSALLPNANYDARLSKLHELPETKVISRFVNPDTAPFWPAMTAFENRAGGRVIVHGWDYGTCVGAAYHGIYRTRQIQAVTHWLFRERAPLVAHGDGVWPLAFRKDCSDRSIAGIFQLSLDAWSEATLTLADARQPLSVQRLDHQGNWSESGVSFEYLDQTLSVRLRGPLQYGKPAIARIAWSMAPNNTANCEPTNGAQARSSSL